MSALITGAQAVHEFRRNRLMATDSRRGGLALDAAAASGMAFLQSQLELIIPDVVKPLQTTTYSRDMPIEIGGGFPEEISAWATEYATTGGSFYGLQGTNNTDIPFSQINLAKKLWPTFNWSNGFSLSYFQVERMKFAQAHGGTPPISLQQLFDESVETTWHKALDYVTYLGFLGNAGLVNNTDVPAAVAVNGGSGTAWSTKTPAQILVDVNFGINASIQNSGYSKAGAANMLLIPYGQFQALTLPMVIGGVGYDSTIDYIKRNCVAKQYGIPFDIQPLPNPWISGMGLGGTDRGIFYKKDKDSIMLKIPTPKTPIMTIPDGKAGPGWTTFFAGCMSCVIFLRTTTMLYLDGI